MEIQIGNSEYYIRSDKYNIILSKKMPNPEGIEEYWNEMGYYGTIEQAYNGLLNRKIRLSSATTLEGLKADIKAIQDLIEVSLQGETITKLMKMPELKRMRT